MVSAFRTVMATRISRCKHALAVVIAVRLDRGEGWRHVRPSLYRAPRATAKLRGG